MKRPDRKLLLAVMALVAAAAAASTPPPLPHPCCVHVVSYGGFQQ